MMKGLILILLLSFIMSCSRLEIESACSVKSIAFLASDGYGMGWNCLPVSLKDGELSMDWEGMTAFQRRGKLVVFAVYIDGPYQGRAYRPRKDDLGSHIVREGKKVYLYSSSVLEGKVN